MPSPTPRSRRTGSSCSLPGCARRPRATTAYFRDRESLAAWGRHGEHLVAQERGRRDWYQTFRLRIARVEEARAWTIRKGATAPEAAGVIHTDFQRGFIKAEVIGFDDLIAAGSTVAARSAGKARMEGKDYVMQDGDVVEFRFNV